MLVTGNFLIICNLSIISCISIQDFLGKSDPFLELARSKEDGTFVVVHRTEVINILLCYLVLKQLHKENIICDLRSVLTWC